MHIQQAVLYERLLISGVAVALGVTYGIVGRLEVYYVLDPQKGFGGFLWSEVGPLRLVQIVLMPLLLGFLLGRVKGLTVRSIVIACTAVLLVAAAINALVIQATGSDWFFFRLQRYPLSLRQAIGLDKGFEPYGVSHGLIFGAEFPGSVLQFVIFTSLAVLAHFLVARRLPSRGGSG